MSRVVLGLLGMLATQAGWAATVDATISGTVLAPQGLPQAGVSVALLPYDPMTPTVAATTTSDAAGRFSFQGTFRPAPWAGSDCFCVVARQAGLSFGWRRCAAQTATVVVQLNPVGELHLPLRDDAGQPIPHVAVRLTRLMPVLVMDQTLYPPDAPEWTATSDATGLCRFAGVPQGLRCEFKTGDPRFAVLSAQYDGREMAAAPVCEADPVRLHPATAVDGRVTGPEGQPLAGVQVWGATQVPAAWQEAVTDADGRYHLDRLVPGNNTVKVMLSEEQLAHWATPPDVPVSLTVGGPHGSVDFTLPTGRVITARVVDDTTSAPMAGVYVFAMGDHWSRRVRTDAAGRAELRVAGEPKSVRAEPLSDAVYDGRDGRTLAWRDGAIYQFRVRRWPAVAPVTGRVLGTDGQPVADAEVRAEPQELGDQVANYNGQHYRAVRTGADGTFVLPLTTLGEQVLLRALKGDLASEQPLPATAGATVELRLAAGVFGTIEATVLDATGHGLPNAAVRLWHVRRAKDGNRSVSWSGMMDEMALTDGRGIARLPHCLPGPGYRLHAIAYGYNELESSEFVLPAGGLARAEPAGARPGMNLLRLQTADLTLTGTVLDGAGAPVAGVDVMGFTATGQCRTTTNAAGHFGLTRLPAGKLFLRAQQNGLKAIAVAGSDTAVLRLQPDQR